MGSALSTQSLPTLPPLTPSLFSSSPPSYKMSQQPDYPAVMGRLGHEQFLFSFSFIF